MTTLSNFPGDHVNDKKVTCHTRKKSRMAADVQVSPMETATPELAAKTRRDKALEDYRKRLIDHKELDDKLKKSEWLCLVMFQTGKGVKKLVCSCRVQGYGLG